MNRGRALGPGRLAKEDGKWVLRWTDEHGSRRRRVLSGDLRTAERIRADVIRRRDLAKAGLGTEVGQEMLLAGLADEYLADLRPRVTPKHFKNVAARLLRIVEDLDGMLVCDLKPMHLIRLRNASQARGGANRTANLIVTTLQAALRWAVENEFIGRNPVAKVKPLPYSAEHYRCRRRAFTDEQLDRFLRAVQEDDDEHEAIALRGVQRVPQFPLFSTLLSTAIRWNEARLLIWRDIDLKRRVLVVRAENAKSNKLRAIPLSRELSECLHRLKMLHENLLGRLPTASEPVFLSAEACLWPNPTTNINRLLRRILIRAGIARIDSEGRKIDLHALRTTCATRMARNGVPIVKAQRILGHSDPRLTAAHYIALDVEDLRDAVELSSSRSNHENDERKQIQ